jgi:putative endonuclease
MPQYWVYILYSPSAKRTYTGQTNDIDRRIIRHNKGMVPSTRPYRPWELVYSEEYDTRADAMKREKYFKMGKGRKDVQLIIGSYLKDHK